MRKTVEITASHTHTHTPSPRIADIEIKSKCLSMSSHSDILMEKYKCGDLKNQNAYIRGKCPEGFFGQSFLNTSS